MSSEKILDELKKWIDGSEKYVDDPRKIIGKDTTQTYGLVKQKIAQLEKLHGIKQPKELVNVMAELGKDV